MMQTSKLQMDPLDLAKLPLLKLWQHRYKKQRLYGHKNPTVTDVLVVDLQLSAPFAFAVARKATMPRTAQSLKVNATSASASVMWSPCVGQRKQQLVHQILHHRFISSMATCVWQKIFKQAMKLRDLWKEACQAKVQFVVDNKVYSVVDRPHNKPMITSKWVFKKKEGVTGKVEKYKAKMVAKGFMQEEGVD